VQAENEAVLNVFQSCAAVADEMTMRETAVREVKVFVSNYCDGTPIAPNQWGVIVGDRYAFLATDQIKLRIVPAMNMDETMRDDLYEGDDDIELPPFKDMLWVYDVTSPALGADVVLWLLQRSLEVFGADSATGPKAFTQHECALVHALARKLNADRVDATNDHQAMSRAFVVQVLRYEVNSRRLVEKYDVAKRGVNGGPMGGRPNIPILRIPHHHAMLDAMSRYDVPVEADLNTVARMFWASAWHNPLGETRGARVTRMYQELDFHCDCLRDNMHDCLWESIAGDVFVRD
jgi:hypothetical protein